MIRSSLVVFLLAFSTVSYADGFDYNYVGLSYGILDLDDIDVDGNGFGVGGSVAVNPDFHVFCGYQSAGLDFGIDVEQFAAGLGYNTALSPTVDAIAQFSYQYAEVSAPGFGSAYDNGFGIGLGLRYAARDVLELNAIFDYIDLGDGGDTGFGLGAFYSFTDSFDVGLSGSWTDDTSSYQLAGRFYFIR